MSNKLILIFFSIYLFSIVNSLELTTICDEVKFEDKKVNSFFRLKLDYPLPTIKSYLFEIEKEELKNQYEELLNDLFTEDFWINGNISNKIDNKLSEITKIKQDLDNGKKRNHNPRHLIISKFNNPNYLRIEQSISLTDKITYFLKNITKLNQNYLTKQILSIPELINNLNNLNSGLDEDQKSTAVFRNKFINVFYNQPIVTFDGIKINRDQNMFLDFSTTSKIEYSIYIPFFDDNLEKIKLNCYANEKLPSFYHSEKKFIITTESIREDLLQEELTL